MSRQNSRSNRITKLRDQKCGRKTNTVSPLRLSSMAFGGISMRTNNPPSSSFCLDRACYTSLVRGYTTSTKPSSIARTNPRSISPPLSSPLSSSLFQNIYESTVNIIAIPYRMFSRFTKEEEALHKEIGQWSSRFKRESIPFNSLEKNFSRSSGPGGQNVNKVSSKAEVRFFLADAAWIHPKVRDKLRQTASRYINSKGEFVISSDVHREQNKNIEECHEKIYQTIQEAAAVPKETSPEQKKKVEKLIAAQKKRDLEEKKRLKERKQDRRDKRW